MEFGQFQLTSGAVATVTDSKIVWDKKSGGVDQLLISNIQNISVKKVGVFTKKFQVAIEKQPVFGRINYPDISEFNSREEAEAMANAISQALRA